MQIVIQSPNLACDISIVIKIHSVRFANRKSKMVALFQDGHEQIHLTLHKAGPDWPNSSICV